MSKFRLTNEEKAIIEDLFKKGVDYNEIATEMERAPQTILNHLDAVGLRKIKRITTPKDKAKAVCSKCGATGHLKGSRFCYRCGTDIRSKEIILTEKLRGLLANVRFLPENCRDETSGTIQEVMRYLEEKGA